MKESFRESLDNIQRYRELSRNLSLFSIGFQLIVLLVLSPLYLPSQWGVYLVLVIVTLLGSTVIIGWLLLHVGLMRDESGNISGLNPANKLTIIRFLLIPPLLFLIIGDHLTAALIVYVVCTGTDIIDGFIARRRNEQTQFGVVMDPLADVFSTAGVFTALLVKNLVPHWVFLLLMIRYGMLIAGTAVLFFSVGPLQFRATLVGKIVGVLQALAVIMIVGLTMSGIDVRPLLGKYLFPFLGLLFCSVIVSQLVLGIGHFRKGSVSIGS